MLIPVRSGPRQGATTVVFWQCPEAEAFVTAFVREHCAFIYHILVNKKGFRDDCALTLCRSFDVAARGRISETTWNDTDWTVETPFSKIADTFASDLFEDGYVLSEEDKLVPVAEGFSSILAEEDVAKVTKELGLKSDATCSSVAGGGVSIVSGATNGTLGVSSIRSVDTQQFHRNLEEQCIANAQAQEEAAAARWANYDAQQNATTPIPQGVPQGSSTSPATAQTASPACTSESPTNGLPTSPPTSSTSSSPTPSAPTTAAPISHPTDQQPPPNLDPSHPNSSTHSTSAPTRPTIHQNTPPDSVAPMSTAPSSTHANSTAPPSNTNSTSPISNNTTHSVASAEVNSGEPASEKQSGLGNSPPISDLTGGAGGPQGPR